MNFIDVGFSNYMDADRIVEVSRVDSSPIKRLIKQAKEEGRYVDVTQGRKTLAVVYSECGDALIITAVAVHAQTIVRRIQLAKNQYVQKKLDDELVRLDSDRILH